MQKTVPLVLQLQSQSMTGVTPIGDALRTARVIATKAGHQDAVQWIDAELGGYLSGDNLPQNRWVHGRVYAYIADGSWLPVSFTSAAHEEMVAKLPIMQSAAAVHQLFRSHQDESTISAHYPPHLQEALRRMFPRGKDFILQFSASQLTDILDSIRFRLLHWSLDLERAGILGHDMMFTSDEKSEAAIVTNNYFTNAQNVQLIGSQSGNSTANQVNHNVDLAQVSALLEQLRPLSSQLPPAAAAPIQIMEDEIAAAEPNTSKVRQALLSLKAVCEGAAGNLVATGAAALLTSIV